MTAFVQDQRINIWTPSLLCKGIIFTKDFQIPPLQQSTWAHARLSHEERMHPSQAHLSYDWSYKGENMDWVGQWVK